MISETFVTFIPSDSINLAVPPVEKIETLFLSKQVTSFSNPFLSETLTRAFFIFNLHEIKLRGERIILKRRLLIQSIYDL